MLVDGSLIYGKKKRVVERMINIRLTMTRSLVRNIYPRFNVLQSNTNFFAIFGPFLGFLEILITVGW